MKQYFSCFFKNSKTTNSVLAQGIVFFVFSFLLTATFLHYQSVDSPVCTSLQCDWSTSSISGLWATCGPDVSSQWPGLWSERETERTTVGTSNPRLTSSIMQLDVTFLIIIIIKFWESKMTEFIIFSPDSEPLFSNWPQQPVIRSYFKCLTQCFLCFLKWWLNFIGCWHQHTNTLSDHRAII